MKKFKNINKTEINSRNLKDEENKKIRVYSSLGTEELLKKLDTSLEGVTKEQAEKKLRYIWKEYNNSWKEKNLSSKK